MDALHAFLLAVIQGLTEFLPISSSAHLALLPIVMQWQDQGVVIDIAAHLGSLLAVVFYFRNDLSRLVGSWLPNRVYGSYHAKHQVSHDDRRGKRGLCLCQQDFEMPFLMERRNEKNQSACGGTQ